MIKNESCHKFIMSRMGLEFKSAHEDLIFHTKGGWSEWEYFGKVFMWAQKQHFWGHFKEETIGEDSFEKGPLLWPISEEFIHPDTFIMHLYEFLRDLEGDYAPE